MKMAASRLSSSTFSRALPSPKEGSAASVDSKKYTGGTALSSTTATSAPPTTGLAHSTRRCDTATPRDAAMGVDVDSDGSLALDRLFARRGGFPPLPAAARRFVAFFAAFTVVDLRCCCCGVSSESRGFFFDDDSKDSEERATASTARIRPRRALALGRMGAADLVAALLRAAAMRSRHWKALADSTSHASRVAWGSPKTS
mmetsp:Transcript_12422/g.40612  ORF Transcript_12422/g.40612 Transcript_12422/m.40612 type:complete len:201 (+) Transcript_12422:1661-2263(+)